jgi:hypothetical protein
MLKLKVNGIGRAFVGDPSNAIFRRHWQTGARPATLQQ